ncbi:MAG TPA: ABC transporter permease [Candidatus Polarisedimenticolia bacterium]|nr:ABC transporter permease [Candidatus Polarisedimenticolia bacterium]
MRWNRFMAIARKEIIQIRRDTRSLLIVAAMPVVLVLLFGYGVNLDLKHLAVCVYDQDGSQASQDLLKNFQSSRYFRIVQVSNSYTEVVRALDDGRARMCLVIPWNFSQKLREGGTVKVQALVDATDDNTAGVLINYAQAVVQGYSSNLQMAWLERHGQSGLSSPLSVAARTWFNENLESSAFILPGVLALVMSVIGAFLTSLTIAREWERGTMEQLVSTPVTPLEILLGKLVPYFVIGLLATAACAAIAVFWFQVPFRGNVVTLLLTTALFLVVVLSIGFLISVVAKSQLASSQIALLVAFMPAFLLSGFLFPIEQMPTFIRLVTFIVPARYYTAALKDIFLKGNPVAMLYNQLIPLVIFALALAVVATRVFHKRLT